MTGVYLHLPFCRVQCTYCPFAVSTDRSLEQRYIDALLREIETRAPAAPVDVDTIFLGGGTPSLTAHANLQRVMDAIRRHFAVAPKGVEMSMEANPEDVSPAALARWQALGVNRVSIGVQSFHDGVLYPLGRGHTSALARQAVRDAVASGVRTSLDLIAGLPQQTAESFRETLATAIDLGANHLSLYMLDLEEGTALQKQVERGRTRLPEDELTSSLYLEAIEQLAAAGLTQYEISNFARPGEECRHNVRYWKREAYYGFGLGAHSFLGEERRANLREIGPYMETLERGEAPIDFTEQLTGAERRRELIFLGLRQTSGLDYSQLIEFCGEEGIQWTKQGLESGWLVRRGGSVALTPSGFLFSNEYIAQLF
jgi:putative oxygen-independent coproporphyrinogen III oxidase